MHYIGTTIACISFGSSLNGVRITSHNRDDGAAIMIYSPSHRPIIVYLMRPDRSLARTRPARLIQFWALLPTRRTGEETSQGLCPWPDRLWRVVVVVFFSFFTLVDCRGQIIIVNRLAYIPGLGLGSTVRVRVGVKARASFMVNVKVRVKSRANPNPNPNANPMLFTLITRVICPWL